MHFTLFQTFSQIMNVWSVWMLGLKCIWFQWFDLWVSATALKTLFNNADGRFKKKLLKFDVCVVYMMFRWVNEQPGMQKFWSLFFHYQPVLLISALRVRICPKTKTKDMTIHKNPFHVAHKKNYLKFHWNNFVYFFLFFSFSLSKRDVWPGLPAQVSVPERRYLSSCLRGVRLRPWLHRKLLSDK